MFDALARLASAHPRRVLALAAVLAVAALAYGRDVAGSLAPYGATDPATDSARSDALVRRATGLDPGTGLIALVPTPAGPSAPVTRRRVARVAAVLRRDPAVGTVASGAAGQVARNGRSQYVAARFRDVGDGEQQNAAERLGRRLAGTGARLGGSAAASRDVNRQVESDLRRAELLAFPLLFLLSLLFFRSAVAALLPLLVGGLAIVGTLVGLELANGLTDVSVFALNLTTGLGLGLAIDYSLFVVARYREELERSGPGPEALRATMRSAGRTVLFSSLTVTAALTSLLVFPQRFLFSMGLGGAMVTVVAAAVSLVVLPAVLALLGPRVNALAPAWLTRRARLDARGEQRGFWYRLSRSVMRRPLPVAVGSALMLVLAGLPFLRTQFTAIDATVLPPSAPARQVDGALRRDFPRGRADAVTVALATRPSAAVRRYARGLGTLPGAAGSSAPRALGRRATLIEVYPRAAPLAPSSLRLVKAIRARPPPARALAGGQSAAFADLKASLRRHLPVAFAIVAAATLIVLFLMTGSVVLPFKALAMNVLTLSATFGLLTLVFQDGRLEGLLGYSSQGALETTMPVLLFALAFGLSTDYGVFLLARIKEARDAGASDSEAVAVGLQRTGRIVTAAALLFSVAIGAFATSQIVFIKENGVGTALAVLIDATLVRALLVPALMALLGRRNWWAPAPLARLHRRIGLGEAGGEHAGAAALGRVPAR